MTHQIIVEDDKFYIVNPDGSKTLSKDKWGIRMTVEQHTDDDGNDAVRHVPVWVNLEN